MSSASQAQDFSAQRARLVAEVAANFAETRAETGLATMSEPVRAALGKIERHLFVPQFQRHAAYRNSALGIGQGQTISQPFIVALSTELIQPQPRQVVLEVGTGSGYQAAMLAEVVSRVYSIELLEGLARSAEKTLQDRGYTNVELRVGDGYRGWPEKAPFDAIVVTAAAPFVPQTLVEQLKPGGRMVIPVGASGSVQELLLVTKQADGRVQQKSVLQVRFVPLVPGK